MAAVYAISWKSRVRSCAGLRANQLLLFLNPGLGLRRAISQKDVFRFSE
jgi:hypothetical protein